MMEAGVRLDTSERSESFVLRGRNGTRMRLSPVAYYLLENGRAGRTDEELAAGLASLTGQPVSVPEVEDAYRQLEARVRSIEDQPAPAPSGFWLALPVIPEAYVAPVARAVAYLFHPAVALVVIALAAVVAGLALAGGRTPAPGTEFLAAYGLFFLSLVAHEFGHAGACARGGGRPSAIGLGIYLAFPVLFSNVTAAWEMRRWQRVVVDLGGIYVQGIVGVAYLAAALATGNRTLVLASALIGFSCLLSLNPFFKFDGYWAIGDALGVVNLGHQRGRLLKYFRERLTGRRPQALPWPPTVSAFVAGYLAAATTTWVAFLVFVVPTLARRALDYPALLGADLPRLLGPAHSLPAGATQSLLVGGLVVIGLGTLVVRFGLATVKALARIRSRLS
jgi:putative peptide zinc metalloprotease protein